MKCIPIRLAQVPCVHIKFNEDCSDIQIIGDPNTQEQNDIMCLHLFFRKRTAGRYKFCIEMLHKFLLMHGLKTAFCRNYIFKRLYTRE
jgi:hypothetical protein